MDNKTTIASWPHKLDVEALRLKLNHGATIQRRFRLTLPLDEVRDYLVAAYLNELDKYNATLAEDTTETERVIDQAARWLVSDRRLGLMLCGLCGNGKTTLMRAIAAVVNYLCSQTRDHITIDGAMRLARLCSHDDGEKEFNEISGCRLLAVDDFGEEPVEVMKFGSVITPMTDLILRRYNQHMFTIISTNLTPSEMAARYGARVADRLKEMMEVIVFRNESYRK